MDRNVFLIKPPAEDKPTKFLVIVYRSGGPFGAGRPTVIAVDKFQRIITDQGNVIGYEGSVAEEVVIAFPADVSYMLIDRSLVSAITPLEAAQQQKIEDDELEKILGPEKEPVAPWPPSDGTYR